ncbi:hypothetical protein [Chitinophaga vietnamensis]|uniref:hypothetical protein n=1 Tax=Chitinophaga vietnamensis TaxID=2593957 RepID=UPI0011774953|nr:hypothetical protein [Chitinophaga vietnamensis]
MQTYHIPFISTWNSALAILVVPQIILLIMVFHIHLPDSAILFTGIFLVWAALCYYIFIVLSVGKTVWTADDEGLRLYWARRFPFHSRKREFYFKWTDIKQFSSSSDGRGNKFLKIWSVAGEHLKLLHVDLIGYRDDYAAFIEMLKQRVRCIDYKWK